MKSAREVDLNGQNSEIEYDNSEPECSKVHNNSEGLRRRIRENIADDVHRMASRDLDEQGKIVIPTIQHDHRRSYCGSSIWSFLFYAMVATATGFAIGYVTELVSAGNGIQNIKTLADKYQETSRTSDGRRCRAALRDVLKVVKRHAIPFAELKTVASRFEYEHHDIKCLFTNFAASYALISLTEPKITCNDISLMNCHTNAHNMVKRMSRAVASQNNCAREAYKSVVLQIIKVCVFNHQEAVFRRTWDSVGGAIVDARLSDWSGAKKASREAIWMMENTFGRNSSKYEVYGWAKHINEVANSKADPDDDEVAVKTAFTISSTSKYSWKKMASSLKRFGIDCEKVLEDSKKKINASESLTFAEDKLLDVNFPATMKRLFPFDVVKQGQKGQF